MLLIGGTQTDVCLPVCSPVRISHVPHPATEGEGLALPVNSNFGRSLHQVVNSHQLSVLTAGWDRSTTTSPIIFQLLFASLAAKTSRRTHLVTAGRSTAVGINRSTAGWLSRSTAGWLTASAATALVSLEHVFDLRKQSTALFLYRAAATFVAARGRSRSTAGWICIAASCRSTASWLTASGWGTAAGFNRSTTSWLCRTTAAIAIASEQTKQACIGGAAHRQDDHRSCQSNSSHRFTSPRLGT
jgi:hypothetical protein